MICNVVCYGVGNIFTSSYILIRPRLVPARTILLANSYIVGPLDSAFLRLGNTARHVHLRMTHTYRSRLKVHLLIWSYNASPGYVKQVRIIMVVLILWRVLFHHAVLVTPCWLHLQGNSNPKVKQ